MLDKLGNKNFTLLGRMLDLHAAKQRVHAQNVANVNTPNYKRREFKFETALKRALAGGRSQDYQEIEGWVDRPNNTPVRNNGNNVDIDMEMAEMQENNASYTIYTQLYNKKSQMVKAAIRGSK
ncbi:MAG: flagellar basal body rod protein FlgB [Chlamydiia bacterium]|nr:flagellar basal body rod protein FlgB [Chlamydiia bacterium]